MGKKFAKLRYGLIDHLATFGGCPDGALIYSMYCHLQAPLQGSQAGKLVIHQQTLADRLGWSRQRVGRAIRWLCTNPSPHRPYLIQIGEARKGQGAEYYIRNFDGEDSQRGEEKASAPSPRDRSTGPDDVTDLNTNGSDDVTDLNIELFGSRALNVTDLNTERKWRGFNVTDLNTTNLYSARARSEQDPSRTRGRFSAERAEGQPKSPPPGRGDQGLTLVSSEREARDLLLSSGHIGTISDPKARELALSVAVKNLHAYGIAIQGEDGEGEDG